MEIKKFLNRHCPYYDMDHADRCYFCNGKPMTDKLGVQAREPCKYYGFNGTFKSGCSHPKRWC